MKELLAQLTSVARGMWKYRWPGLIVAWVIALIGVVLVFRIPNQFEASARIYVDTQSILKPLMSGLTVQPNVEQQVGMLSRTLLSRPNMEKLVRMADLDLKKGTKAESDALVDQLIRNIQIRRAAGDNLYTLSYRDQDQDKAKRVIQSLVSIFVESSLGASRKDTDSAKVFLNEQIKAYEAKLEEAEARVKEFRLKNLDIGLEGRDAPSRVAGITQQLQQAQLELREAENARDAAKAQLAAEKSQTTSSLATQSLMQESALSVATPEIDGRIDALKRNLDSLLQRFTEQHPDVIVTRRLIKDLEEQKKKEVAELRKLAGPSGTGGGTAASPASQELQRMLAASEVQVASLRARVAEYSSRLAQARQSLKTSPQLEAEAAQLNRDYQINKKNYEDLVARRQAAIMSGELDVASGVADFRLIDPPRVSPQPVSPNRMALLPLPLLAGLGGALFLAFAASQVRPVFNDPSELRSRTGLPLLGVVSMVVGETDRRRERADMLRFVSATGSLVGIFVVGFAAMSIFGARGI